MTDRKLEERPPLTQEELENWIGTLEDRAWVATTGQYADRFLLINLVAWFNRAGLLDANAMLDAMVSVLPSVEMPNRLGIESMIAECREALNVPDGQVVLH